MAISSARRTGGKTMKPAIKLQALRCVFGLGLVLALGVPAEAQSYPTKPVTFVVPFVPGGPVDIIARVVAAGMQETLGQPVIVENVAGAGGSIGTGRVARAAPDGYTVAIGNWGTHVANGAIYSLPFDLLKDFEPVSLLPSDSLTIVAKKTMPADSLKQFIGWLKDNPNKALCANSGIGGPSHVGGLLFAKETGTLFQSVPYRGAAPALQDLLAERVDMMISGPSIALAQARSGNLKIYAVASKVHLSAAPDIPTVDEAGLPGFYVTVWHGMWVPKGTPSAIIAKLNAAVRDALARPEIRKRFSELFLEIPPLDQQTPGALGAHQKAEIEKWWPVIKAAAIKPM
jgi:tripartite-type tricarboxylate transporter receptor subunit TctC